VLLLDVPMLEGAAQPIATPGLLNVLPLRARRDGVLLVQLLT
jgi:hypothetical protein